MAAAQNAFADRLELFRSKKGRVKKYVELVFRHLRQIVGNININRRTDPEHLLAHLAEDQRLNQGGVMPQVMSGLIAHDDRDFTAEKCVPDVICQIGSELEALEMLNEMGIIRLLRPKPA